MSIFQIMGKDGKFRPDIMGESVKICGMEYTIPKESSHLSAHPYVSEKFPLIAPVDYTSDKLYGLVGGHEIMGEFSKPRSWNVSNIPPLLVDNSPQAPLDFSGYGRIGQNFEEKKPSPIEQFRTGLRRCLRSGIAQEKLDEIMRLETVSIIHDI